MHKLFSIENATRKWHRAQNCRCVFCRRHTASCLPLLLRADQWGRFDCLCVCFWFKIYIYIDRYFYIEFDTQTSQLQYVHIADAALHRLTMFSIRYISYNIDSTSGSTRWRRRRRRRLVFVWNSPQSNSPKVTYCVCAADLYILLAINLKRISTTNIER